MPFIMNKINGRILPGVQPIADSTNLSSSHFVDADKIRFFNGLPQKIGGWNSVTFEDDTTVSGCPRTIYSQFITTASWLMLGTHTDLYALNGSILTNITPLKTAATVISNSLDSVYGTLVNDPIATVTATNTLTLTHASHRLIPGDEILISGSTAVNGVPAININTNHTVRTVSTNTYTINVGANATSTGVGGGAAVVEATEIVVVNFAVHGAFDGERIKITLATAFAGFTVGQLNKEHIIRNTTANTMDIVLTSTATSSVGGGGGALTEIQTEIAAGECDNKFGQGYGVGRYGVGLYGVSKTSSTIFEPPRIWSFDRFGNNIIMTPGAQTGVYEWDGDTDVAPTAVPNAPTAINYSFVSDNIVATLGDSDVGNRIKWSHQGDQTDWISTLTNLAGEDDIEGADKFITQINVRGTNLLFTSNQVFTMRFIGAPFVWEFKQLNAAEGIIAQNAQVQGNGIAYWMGPTNFYMYSGGSVIPIPSNSPTGQSTIRQHVFGNINREQSVKSYARHVPEFNEIWFHYPSEGSNECDSYVIFNTREQHWTIGKMDRTAAEYPFNVLVTPRMIDIGGTLYRHEEGVDDDGSPMAFSLTTKLFQGDSAEVNVNSVITDSIQTGDITLDLFTTPYAQSTSTVTHTRTVTNTTLKVDFTNANGRNWKYTISQSELGGYWRMGDWYEEIERGTPQSGFKQ